MLAIISYCIDFVVTTVSGDGPAPVDSRPFAYTVRTKFRSSISALNWWVKLVFLRYFLLNNFDCIMNLSSWRLQKLINSVLLIFTNEWVFLWNQFERITAGYIIATPVVTFVTIYYSELIWQQIKRLTNIESCNSLQAVQPGIGIDIKYPFLSNNHVKIWVFFFAVCNIVIMVLCCNLPVPVNSPWRIWE